MLIAKSPPTWPPDGTIGRALVLGRLVAVGDHHGLTPLSIADLRKGLREAQALPWAELLPLLSDRRLESPRGLEWECDAEPDDEVQLRVFATGPMASGLVGFGVPRGDGEPGKRGLEELWGQDMDQKRQPRVVAGVAVGVCDFHDDVGPATLDVSARAHKARTAKLGPLAKKAAYYLLGRYD